MITRVQLTQVAILLGSAHVHLEASYGKDSLHPKKKASLMLEPMISQCTMNY